MQTLQRKNVTTPNYIIYIIQTSKRCHQYNIEHYEQTANIVAVRVRFGNSSAHNIEFPTARRSSPFRKGDGTQSVGVNHFCCYALCKNALKIQLSYWMYPHRDFNTHIYVNVLCDAGFFGFNLLYSCRAKEDLCLIIFSSFCNV